MKMNFKDTFFSNKHFLNCRGRLLQFDTAMVMGIINVTPDSFYRGSRYMDPGEILVRASEMIESGADMLDVGAYSSRPGAGDISETEEISRLEKVIPPIRESFPEVLLSVDTFRSNVARRVVADHDVNIINDISGGDLDENMFEVIAELQVPYVLMHMRGSPATMQNNTNYTDVTREIILSLSNKISLLNSLGVNDIIIDPGFGFAKTIDQNFEILRQLEAFQIFSQPLMTGTSRKSMIYKTLDCDSGEALNGSTVLHTIALLKGANILRVHDVKEAREAILLVKKTMN